MELASILDFEVTSPYINPALFTISNTTNRPYWTSSTLYSNADNAWYINFNT
ncbi:MAG: DUF1566 domain-containing protein [Candidatus Peribacteria bacterium]|nr:DUF1566 domain-containing protein [Candidatus Peribacteria bacterium]